MNALAMLYVYGAALALFIWLARQAGFLLASGLATPVRNEALLSAVDEWAFQLGVPAPRLKRSRHVSSVCIYGAVSPVILMPHDLDAQSLECRRGTGRHCHCPGGGSAGKGRGHARV
ncbi:MAG: hypothetical protein HC850_14535 [Rhodomicrobium sp.]|nr:hypothetical protein [Rhodomicrobium sp.]